MTMKVRLSTMRKDLKVTVLTTERVRDLKKRLEIDHGVDHKKISLALPDSRRVWLRETTRRLQCCSLDEC